MELIEAIEQRRLLAFTYHGRARVVEPHTYGVDAKGRKLLVGFQVAGSASEALPVWRTFRETEMRDVAVLEQRFFRAREEYQYNDGMFAAILAQLPP